jgi:hypothetical protein
MTSLRSVRLVTGKRRRVEGDFTSVHRFGGWGCNGNADSLSMKEGKVSSQVEVRDFDGSQLSTLKQRR